MLLETLHISSWRAADNVDTAAKNAKVVTVK